MYSPPDVPSNQYYFVSVLVGLFVCFLLLLTREIHLELLIPQKEWKLLQLLWLAANYLFII